MATLKLDLSNLSIDTSKKQLYIIDADKTSLKYAGYKVEAVSTNGKTVTFADGSTLTTDDDGKLTFKSESGTGTFDVAVAADDEYKTDIVTKVQNAVEAVAGMKDIATAKDALQ